VNNVNSCTDKERVENDLESTSSTSSNSSNSTAKKKRKPAVSATFTSHTALLAASPAAHVS
jgi:hypothetical protein